MKVLLVMPMIVSFVVFAAYVLVMLQLSTLLSLQLF